MDDERRHKRVSCKDKNIHCRVQFSTDVNLLNISTSGGAIKLNKQLHIGKEYIINMKRGDNIISVKGTVVWEKLVASEKNKSGDLVPVYRAGIQFRNILTEEGQKIIDFISENLVPAELKARLGGIRIDISGSESDVLINNNKNFKILKMSLSGMLLKTDVSLETGDTCWMELHLTDNRSPVHVVGKVVSSRQIGDDKHLHYETAMEIIKIGNDDRAVLARYIDALIEDIA